MIEVEFTSIIKKNKNNKVVQKDLFDLYLCIEAAGDCTVW